MEFLLAANAVLVVVVLGGISVLLAHRNATVSPAGTEAAEAPVPDRGADGPGAALEASNAATALPDEVGVHLEAAAAAARRAAEADRLERARSDALRSAVEALTTRVTEIDQIHREHLQRQEDRLEAVAENVASGFETARALSVEASQRLEAITRTSEAMRLELAAQIESAAHALERRAAAAEQAQQVRSAAFEAHISGSTSSARASSEVLRTEVRQLYSGLASRFDATQARRTEVTEALRSSVDALAARVTELGGTHADRLEALVATLDERLRAIEDRYAAGQAQTKDELLAPAQAVAEALAARVGEIDQDQRANVEAVEAVRMQLKEDVQALRTAMDVELGRTKAEILAGLHATSETVAQRDAAAERRESDRTSALRSGMDALAARLVELDRLQHERIEALSGQLTSIRGERASGMDQTRDAILSRMSEIAGSTSAGTAEVRRQIDDLRSAVTTRLDVDQQDRAETTAALAAATADRIAELRAVFEERLSAVESQTATELVQIRDALSAQLRAMSEALAQREADAGRIEALSDQFASIPAQTVGAIDRTREEILPRLQAVTDALERHTSESAGSARAGTSDLLREIGDLRSTLIARLDAEEKDRTETANTLRSAVDRLAARSAEIDQIGERIDALSEQLTAVRAQDAGEVGAARDEILSRMSESAESARAVAADLHRRWDDVQYLLTARLEAEQTHRTEIVAHLGSTADALTERVSEIDRLQGERLERSVAGLTARLDAATAHAAETLVALSTSTADRISALRTALEEHSSVLQAQTATELGRIRDGLGGQLGAATDAFAAHHAAAEQGLHERTNALLSAVDALVQRIAEWDRSQSERSGALERHMSLSAAEIAASTADRIAALRTALEEQLSVARAQSATDLGQTRDELGAQMLATTEAFARSEAAAEQREDERMNALRAMVAGLTARATELDQLHSGRLEALSAEVATRIDAIATQAAELGASVAASTADQIAGLRTAIDEKLAAIQSESQRELGSAREQLQAAIDASGQRAADAIRASSDGVRSDMGEVRALVAASADESGAMRTALDERIGTILPALTSRLDAETGARSELADAIRSTIDGLAALVTESDRLQGERQEALSAEVATRIDAIATQAAELGAVAAASVAEGIAALRTTIDKQFAEIRIQSARDLGTTRRELLAQLEAIGAPLAERAAELERTQQERSDAMERQISASAESVRSSAEIMHALRTAIDALVLHLADLEVAQRDALDDVREIRRRVRAQSFFDRPH